MSAKYVKYNDPVQISWRSGDVLDPYVDVVQPNLKIINGRVALVEIPDEFNHVIIDGYTEIYKDSYGNVKVPASNEFYCDYSNGYLYFNPAEDGKAISVIYKGRGQVQYPAERIYVHQPNPYAVENLQEFVELCIRKIAETNEAIANAKIATEEANIATANTIEATNKANEAIINAEQATEESIQATAESIEATSNCIEATNQAITEKSLLEQDRIRTRLIYQDPVSSFPYILSTYEYPEIGYVVATLDNGNEYRWDGYQWQFIRNSTGSIFRASETMDGLLTKEDYTKLKWIEAGAEVNLLGEDAKDVLPSYFKIRTIVFTIPDELVAGVQPIVISFPYNGKIQSISAILTNQGIEETSLAIEKISKADFIDVGEWLSVLSRNILLPYGSRVDDGIAQVANQNVSAGDMFRVNIISATGAKDLTVEINIEI